MDGPRREIFVAGVALLLDTDEWRFNPSPDVPMEKGDILIALGNTEVIERLRRDGAARDSTPAATR
jgi:uncharacterized protein with PhoU and TrkA domain